MINKEQALAWATELRSGNYRQGRGALKVTNCDNINEHCCLGILAEQLKLFNGPMPTYNSGNPVVAYPVGTDIAYLPPDVLDVELQSYFAKMNDAGKSFIEIAESIEAYAKLGQFK